MLECIQLHLTTVMTLGGFRRALTRLGTHSHKLGVRGSIIDLKCRSLKSLCYVCNHRLEICLDQEGIPMFFQIKPIKTMRKNLANVSAILSAHTLVHLSEMSCVCLVVRYTLSMWQV